MTRNNATRDQATRALSVKVRQAFWDELDEFVKERPAMTKSGVLRAGFELFKKQQLAMEQAGRKEARDGQ
jgi:hypothetical protein